jgi:hypothetical protein
VWDNSISRQTRLPDGTSSAVKNTQHDPLTSADSRVMNVITEKKEANNAYQRQESISRNETHREVPQTGLLSRSNPGGEREAPLSSPGREGIQEPVGCRDGGDRTLLRRLEVLECGNYRGHSGSSYRNPSITEEKNYLPCSQPEECPCRPNTLVLQGLRRELPCRHGNNSRYLPAGSQSLISTSKQIVSKQAPIIGGLPRYEHSRVTMPLVSRGYQC